MSTCGSCRSPRPPSWRCSARSSLRLRRGGERRPLPGEPPAGRGACTPQRRSTAIGAISSISGRVAERDGSARLIAARAEQMLSRWPTRHQRLTQASAPVILDTQQASRGLPWPGATHTIVCLIRGEPNGATARVWSGARAGAATANTCVEVAEVGHDIAIRDAKRPDEARRCSSPGLSGTPSSAACTTATSSSTEPDRGGIRGGCAEMPPLPFGRASYVSWDAPAKSGVGDGRHRTPSMAQEHRCDAARAWKLHLGRRGGLRDGKDPTGRD